jgi:hypothetical protein
MEQAVNSKREWKILGAMAAVFGLAYYLPLANPRVTEAILEAFKLLQWYARNHTLACVVPALFIAGGITTFLSQAAVLRYLGPDSNKLAAYSVASVSGVVLAVCSCSVLPMFAGIYNLGAGLGPASAFLYSGPAINVLAIFLTARVLGFELGIWRATGAIVFAVLVGLGMHTLFRGEQRKKVAAAAQMPAPPPATRRVWQNALLLAAMIAFLIFSDWFNPGDAIVRRTDGSQIRRPRRRPDHDLQERRRRNHRSRKLGHGRLPRALVSSGGNGFGAHADDLALCVSRRVLHVDGQHVGLRQVARATAVRRRVRRRFYLGTAAGSTDRGTGRR